MGAVGASFEELGWDGQLARSFDEVVGRLHKRDLVPGRIVRQERKLLRVATPQGELDAKNAGRLVRSASPEQLPVIGDWVAVTPAPGGGEGLIHALVPRRNVLLRKEAGSEHRAQAMAANVDLVLAVWGLDRPLNVRWLERAATLVSGCGAPMVVLLTKADLAADVDAEERAAKLAAPEAEVVVVSATTGFGMDVLEARLSPRHTHVVMGMSGSGKSTLINRLVGEERLATGEVREDDRKGRHTTTHRELVKLSGGALLVDSPGMRELGLWQADEAVAETFTDIEERALACRFADCRHGAEPGCAVRAAVERGEVDAARLENFRLLQQEQAQRAKPHERSVTRGVREIGRARRRS